MTSISLRTCAIERFCRERCRGPVSQCAVLAKINGTYWMLLNLCSNCIKLTLIFTSSDHLIRPKALYFGQENENKMNSPHGHHYQPALARWLGPLCQHTSTRSRVGFDISSNRLRKSVLL